jgi:uncharacterized membrane protein (UPF0127 family)
MPTRRFVSPTLPILLTLLMPVAGCEQNGSRSSNKAWWTVPMQIGNKTFKLEVADTYESRKTGLMHRKSMPADHGMIFVFADEQPLAFWMKNTLIPLDVIYLDAKGKVVSVKKLEALDLTPVDSEGPAKYAIEINRGAAADAGVKPGDVLTIPERAREPAK